MDALNATTNASPSSVPAPVALHHLRPLTRNERIEQNAALVPFTLAPLLRQFPTLSPDDRADVMAAGMRGLVVAADKYDPDKGAFSTYACRWIQGLGRKALAKCGSICGGDWKAKRAGFAVTELDAPALGGVGGKGGDGMTCRVDLLTDEHAGEPFAALLDAADDGQRAARLWRWIKVTVTPAQWDALRLCYADGRSQDEAASTLRVSTQAVSGRIKNGLAALRKAAQTDKGQQAVAKILGGE